MYRHVIIVTLLALLSSYPVNMMAANVLAIIPLPSRSHFTSFQPLLEEIVQRGHNLTLVGGYTLNKRLKSNYTHVDVLHHFKELKVVFAELRKKNEFEILVYSANVIQNYSEYLLQQSEMQSIIRSDDNYDLVLAELFFMDVFIAFGCRFDAPVIGLSAQNLISVYSWMLGDPFTTSFVPNLFLPMTEKMSFAERTLNTVYSSFAVLYYNMINLPTHQNQVEKYFKFGNGKNIPQLADAMKNISVTFVNTHYSFGYPKPRSPNIIETAGIHLTEPKPLPPNIKIFMDEAPNGVIYLSLGSLINPDDLKKLGRSFVEILKNLPQKILLKWNPKLLLDVPSNFLVQEWVPQIDVLNHPNCRVFVTHGGLHSLLESLNSSVPIIGIPFFSDQQHNIRIVEYYDIGLKLQFENIGRNLLSAVKEILQNPKYKKNIEKRKKLFNERITSPLETAMYWVEYVLKHKDTSHLRPAGLELRWYQYFLLDIFVTLLLVLFSTISIIYFIVINLVRAFIRLKSKRYSRSGTVVQNRKMIDRCKRD